MTADAPVGGLTGRDLYVAHGWSGCAGSAWENLPPAVRDGWEFAAAREAAARAEERERIAQAIERRRNEHWQKHLADHPLADGRSCPGDYAAHDAYYDAARIARADAPAPREAERDCRCGHGEHLHDRHGQLDRSICGLCGDAYVECFGCGLYLCDCTRGVENAPREGGR